MACVTHANRFLHLSGDEVFFYFQGMKDNWSDYRSHYEQIRDQIGKEKQEPYFQGLSQAQADNLRAAEFYFGIEPQFFSEYRLPRLLWGTVSAIVAPTKTLALSDEALSEGVADSVFFMLIGGYLIVCLLVAAITYRLTGYVKAALIVFVLLTFLKESFVTLNEDTFRRTLPDEAAVFLSTAASPGKDFMAFSFSARSQFLLLFVAYLACRWSMLSRNPVSYASYLMLPALTLVHASQGVLITGMFFAIDCIMWRRRLNTPLVLLSYAASFALGLDGGMAGGPFSFAGLSLLTVLLLIASASIAQTEARKSTIPSHAHLDSGSESLRATWRREALLAGTFVLAFLLLGRPLAQRIGLQDNFLFMTLAIRLGSIFGVGILFMLSWIGVELVSRKLKPRVGASLAKTCSLALIGPLLIAGVVAGTDLSFDLAGVRSRLRSESSAYLAHVTIPLSFRENNELHVIWYSIIKSAIHNKNYPVKMQLRD